MNSLCRHYDVLHVLCCSFFSVDAEDVKRIGSTINVLSSEKLKAQKASHRSLFIPIGLQHSQKVFFFKLGLRTEALLCGFLLNVTLLAHIIVYFMDYCIIVKHKGRVQLTIG